MSRRTLFPILVGVLACAMFADAAAQVEYIDPGPGFTQVVTTTNAGVKTIFVSGQVGRGDTLREHVESAFADVVRRLEQAGATPADVVKIRIFVKDFEPAQYATVAEVRLATFPEEYQWPASTMIGVRALAAESLRVEIEAIAVVAEPGVELQIERFAPSNGFSGAVAVTAHGVKTVYVAGQIAGGDSLAAQTAAVWERVAQRLDAAGASLADLVKATTYIVDFDPETDLPAYRTGREQALALDDMPASTLLGIQALAAEQFRIEIDGIAVVGVDGNAVEREFIDPATGFTQAVTARGAGPKVVQVSGQVGRPGDSLESQADQVYASLRRRLEAAGAGPEDLLKVVIYMPEYARGDFAVVDAARKAHGFPDAAAPAATLLGIQSLFAAGALLEVEGIAVVEQDDAPIGVPVPPLGDGPWVFDTAEQHKVRVSVVAGGLSHPWSIAFMPGGGMLITERDGRLRVIRDGELDPRPVSGVPDVRTDGNGGLMDVALHPDFAANGLVYLTYTKGHADGRGSPALARGRLEGHALSDVRDLVVTEPYHSNGGLNGRVAFGRDGKVYMSTGGRILSEDGVLLDAPQDPAILRGKVLRLNDDGSAPDDNPFVDEPGHRPEIYTIGHRNTLGLMLHPVTGDIWQHENGPNGGDELNVLQPGRNYGWPLMSFGRLYSGTRISQHPTRDGYESPLLVWLPAIAAAGMEVYTGDRFPAWNGNLFIGSLQMGGIPGTGHLQRIVFNEHLEELRRELMLTELRQRIREVRQGPDGFLYVLTDHADDGALLRIEPAP